MRLLPEWMGPTRSMIEQTGCLKDHDQRSFNQGSGSRINHGNISPTAALSHYTIL